MNIVEMLQDEGFKVFVNHFRFPKNIHCETPYRVDPHYTLVSKFGGETRVEIVDNEGMRFIGATRCRTDEVFNRKRGVEIASGRALKAMLHRYEFEIFGAYTGKTDGLTIQDQMGIVVRSTFQAALRERDNNE